MWIVIGCLGHIPGSHTIYKRETVPPLPHMNGWLYWLFWRNYITVWYCLLCGRVALNFFSLTRTRFSAPGLSCKDMASPRVCIDQDYCWLRVITTPRGVASDEKFGIVIEESNIIISPECTKNIILQPRAITSQANFVQLIILHAHRRFQTSYYWPSQCRMIPCYYDNTSCSHNKP